MSEWLLCFVRFGCMLYLSICFHFKHDLLWNKNGFLLTSSTRFSVWSSVATPERIYWRRVRSFVGIIALVSVSSFPSNCQFFAFNISWRMILEQWKIVFKSLSEQFLTAESITAIFLRSNKIDLARCVQMHVQIQWALLNFSKLTVLFRQLAWKLGLLCLRSSSDTPSKRLLASANSLSPYFPRENT